MGCKKVDGERVCKMRFYVRNPRHGFATWGQSGFKKLLSVKFHSIIEKQLNSVVDKVDSHLKKVHKTTEIKEKTEQLYKTYTDIGAFLKKIKYPGFKSN